eukprot:3450860-Rhodomonas_salina.1
MTFNLKLRSIFCPFHRHGECQGILDTPALAPWQRRLGRDRVTITESPHRARNLTGTGRLHISPQAIRVCRGTPHRYPGTARATPWPGPSNTRGTRCQAGVDYLRGTISSYFGRLALQVPSSTLPAQAASSTY